jgi:hypothetical protein
MSEQKYPQGTKTTPDGNVAVRQGRLNYSSGKSQRRQDQKREEAFSRQDKYDRMSLSQQLVSCVPGGSVKQRSKIEAAMAKAVPVVTVTPDKKKVTKKKVAAK